MIHRKRSLQGVVLFAFLLAFLVLPWRGLFAQTATVHSVTLGWTAVPGGGVTYTVYRATSSTGPFTAVGTGITTTTFKDTTATPGVAYVYEVDAVSTATGNDSGPSAQVSATEPSNPNPPTGLVVVSVQ